MTCLLVQKDLTPPSAEQLKRAFKLVKTFTDADAAKLARDAYGILLHNLTRVDAQLLQRTLQAEGVATDVIETDRWPKLADAKFIKRAGFTPAALVLNDALGRPLPVEWSHITLIAAGKVRHFDLSTTHTEERRVAYSPMYGVHMKTERDIRHKFEDDAQWLVDIFLAGGALRFQIEAANFLFKFTFERPDLELAGKTALLVQMLAQHAPHAALNRGAFFLRENPASDFAYAGKKYLFDESSWLLWRLAQAGK